MLLLGFDLETTWLDPIDPSEMRIIEIGAVLYDTARSMPVDMMNVLVKVDEELFTPDIEKLTGISKLDLIKHGILCDSALSQLNYMMDHCDYVVAHNGNKFDKIVYEAECERNGIDIIPRPWIDTRIDVVYPDHVKSRKLSYLAADHGFANPYSHRALFDVLTMMKVLENYDIDEVIARSKEKTFLVTANVSFQDKQQAKDRGYFWNGEDKKWQKEMKESELKTEETEAPFYIASKEIE